MTSFANILKSIGANAVTAGSGMRNKPSNAAGSAGDSQSAAASTDSRGNYNRQTSPIIHQSPYPAQDSGSGNESARENEPESNFGKIAEGITDSANKSNKPKREGDADPLSLLLGGLGGGLSLLMQPEIGRAEEPGNTGYEDNGIEGNPFLTDERKAEGWMASQVDDGIYYNPNRHGGANNEDKIRAYNSASGNYFTMPNPEEGNSIYDPLYYEWLSNGRYTGEEIPRTPGGVVETNEKQNEALGRGIGSFWNMVGDTYALSNPFLPDEVREEVFQDYAYQKHLNEIANGDYADTVAAAHPKKETERTGRGEKRTILNDYYDYLGTDEGQEWAKLYEEYADPEVGLARLLDSGDIDAFMQMLGNSDGWNGSTRMRARYNNSIPGLYDWRTGEFNEDAYNMASDYLWGDDSLSIPGLAAGTDNLSRILSPEDAALLAQWSNLLADQYGFGMGIEGDPYGFDARDAALYLYATAMTGDNALDFDQDITNKMLERAKSNQRVGDTESEPKAALPTMDARGYAIPDIDNGSLNPIFEGKSTPYYDYALLESMVASANARNNGKYGIYGI